VSIASLLGFGLCNALSPDLLLECLKGLRFFKVAISFDRFPLTALRSGSGATLLLLLQVLG